MPILLGRKSGSAFPSWWTVDSASGSESVTFDGKVVARPPLASDVGVSVQEQEDTAFGNGYELLDPLGHKVLAIYSQRYPLDATRREGVIEMFGRESDGSFTNGGFLAYGGGNISVQSDSSVVYPIDWIDGDTLKKIFRLRKAGGVVFGGEGAAIPDADISNGGFGLWLDGTPGATKLKIKAKDSGGTVRVGEVALA